MGLLPPHGHGARVQPAQVRSVAGWCPGGAGVARAGAVAEGPQAGRQASLPACLQELLLLCSACLPASKGVHWCIRGL